MKSTVEQINPVQYRVNVEISPDEVNKAFAGVYRKLQQRARIQGFRPGKAPLNVVRRLYGSNAASEVHESLINTHLFSALGEQTFRPIAAPVVEVKTVPAENVPFAFSAVVDVMPEIKIDDYKGLAVDAETYTVKDETFDRELKLLRRSQARTRPVEDGTVAAAGLLAAIGHSATQDGQPVANMTVQNMTVALGEGEVFAGLDDAIVGMKVGETKTAKITLPDTYGDAALAGKELDFTITLNDLKHMDIPALDDEFAKDLNLESAEALKTSLREQLETRAKDLGRQRLENAILSKILDAHPFEVPPAMVDQVIDSMIQEELAQHPEATRKEAMTNKDLRASLLDTAKRRTQNTLLLWHVTQKEQLTVTEDEVKDRVSQTLASAGIADPKQIAALKKNLEPRLRESLMFEKAMDFLINHATVTALPSAL